MVPIERRLLYPERASSSGLPVAADRHFSRGLLPSKAVKMEILFLKGAKHFLGLDVKIVQSVKTFRAKAGRRRGKWWMGDGDSESSVADSTSCPDHDQPDHLLRRDTHANPQGTAAAGGWRSLASHSFTESDVVQLEAMLSSESEAEREMASLILELRTYVIQPLKLI